MVSCFDGKVLLSLTYYSLLIHRQLGRNGCLYRLVNYTPLATVIRLISLNCINLWMTMSIISFTEYDPELYLLAWIVIASVHSPVL